MSDEAVTTAEPVAEVAAPTTEAPSGLQFSSDELNANETLKRFKSTDDLAQSFLDTKSLVGAKTVAIPGANATPEQMAKFHTALGVPDDAAGYEVPKEGLPEGVVIDEGLAKEFAQFAKEKGFNKDQYASALRFKAELDAKQIAAYNQQQLANREQATQDLQKEWGAAYEQKNQLAQAALRKFGGDDMGKVIEGLDAIGKGDSKDVMVFLANVGQALAQDEVHGIGHNASFTPSPLAARQKLTALQADPEFMSRMTHRNPNVRNQAKQEFNELISLIGGEKKSG